MLIMGEEVLERRRRLLSRELSRAVEELRRMGAEKVILIGSMAEGRIGPFSDIDLMVVLRTDKRFLDRLKDVYGRIRPRVAMDILVYTPEELEEMERISPFIRHAMGKGKVLYAA